MIMTTSRSSIVFATIFLAVFITRHECLNTLNEKDDNEKVIVDWKLFVLYVMNLFVYIFWFMIR